MADRLPRAVRAVVAREKLEGYLRRRASGRIMSGAMKAKPDLHDVVELREPRGGQPVGAVGAVVELFRTGALVEFTDEHGRTIELLDVPYEGLIVRSPEPAERRAAG